MTSSPDQSHAERLGAFVAQTRFEDLPDPMVAKTKRHILDTFGAGLAGATSDESRRVCAMIGASGESGETVIWGRQGARHAARGCARQWRRLAFLRARRHRRLRSFGRGRVAGSDVGAGALRRDGERSRFHQGRHARLRSRPARHGRIRRLRAAQRIRMAFDRHLRDIRRSGRRREHPAARCSPMHERHRSRGELLRAGSGPSSMTAPRPSACMPAALPKAGSSRRCWRGKA